MAQKPKKRPWFQYHLSTAVVLMFVASGLLWLNMRPRHVWRLPGQCSIRYVDCGYPMTFLSDGMVYPINDSPGVEPLPPFPYHLFQPAAFVVDLCLVIGIVGLVGVVLEWRIRRKSAKAEPPKEETT